MVRYRGISVNVISQFDAQRLPEYSTARSFDALDRVAACHIPIKPGADLCFEYSLDGPHPDKAAYFFKLLIDGQVVTSWDCTEKHEYCGKTVVFLHTAIPYPSSGLKTVLQNSIAFASTHGSKSPKVAGDCIEVRVHRIGHRRRLRDLPLDGMIAKSLQGQGALRIVQHGTIEPGRPARKYQYRLLDPRDKPYATFRFYCRTQEYLARHQILNVDRSSTSTSLATPTSSYFDARSSPGTHQQLSHDHISHGTPSTPTKRSDYSCSRVKSPVTNRETTKSPNKANSPRRDTIPTIRIKGSIEDLSTTVPRSPQSIKSPPLQPDLDNVPPSPTRLSSPLLPEALKILRIPKRRSPNKPLETNKPFNPVFPSKDSTTGALPPPRFNIGNTTPTSVSGPTPTRPSHQRHKLTLNGSAFDPDPFLEPRDRRSLSPFTPSGLLRKISSASVLRSQRSMTPNTAAVVVPTVDEINEIVRRKSDEIRREKGEDRDTGLSADDSVESTPRKLMQKCSLWAAGRSGWTRRQKVEGGS